MDIKYLFIGISALISTIRGDFPFETGPHFFDPFGPYFASSDLDPLAVRQFVNSVSKHRKDYYNKIPTNNLRNRFHDNSIKSLKTQLMKFPIDKIESEYNIPIKVQPKRKYKKMHLPELKFNNHNYKMRSIRPKHSEDTHLKNDFPIKGNFYKQKHSLNSINSNTNERFPRKYAPNVQSIYSEKTKHLIGSNFDKRPSTHDIDLSISSDDESKEILRPKHFIPPPNQYKPHLRRNHLLKGKSLGLQTKRPGLYQMEAPKNLHLNRPSIVVQNFQVPHQTLLEIADISGPKYNNRFKSNNVFNDFYHNSKPKLSDSEIIVNNLNEGMSTARQVKASMTVKPNTYRNEFIGKVFDEPLSSALKNSQIGKPESYKKHTNSKAYESDSFSFSTKPFKFNGMKSIYSKPIQLSPNDNKPHNQEKNYNQKSETQFQNQNSQSSHPQNTNYDNFDKNSKESHLNNNYQNNDDKYETDYEDYTQNDNNELSKQSNLDSNPTEYTMSTMAPNSIGSNTHNEKLHSEDSEEWVSNGIPGEAGKDYPLLSEVPFNLAFSCSGKPHGFYADISQKCQVYHQCSPQGQQKFLCPNGTLFNQESLVCEWWYNVYCENSEKLYHKNALLYQSNKDKQNGNNNEQYSNPWNYNNKRNDKINHNHYSNEDKMNSNHYKVGSNLREQYSTPDSDYDQNEDEINVEVS